jgi:hypothetical protein
VIGVYSVAALAGFVALVAWMMLTAGVTEGSRWDPESRLGRPGRRVIAGTLGFGLAGLSAEFSPRSIPWPAALALAVVGAVAMVLITDRLAAVDAGKDG